MTEIPETEAVPVVDFSAMTATDAPSITEPIRPDHKASREDKPRRLRKPPTERTTRARTTKPKVTVPNRKGQFIKPLKEIYTTVGMVVYVRDQVCGNAIISSAERCAETLDELAYRNELVRRTLHSLIATSNMGAVIFAHLPIILAIGMHHVPAVQTVMGNIPAEMVQDIVMNMAAAQNQPMDEEPVSDTAEEAA